MIKRILALDGVQVICQFRDDGAFVEGYGMMPEQQIRDLTTQQVADLLEFLIDGMRELQIFRNRYFGLRRLARPHGW